MHAASVFIGKDIITRCDQTNMNHITVECYICKLILRILLAPIATNEKQSIFCPDIDCHNTYDHVHR